MVLSVELFPKDYYSLLMPLIGIFCGIAQASIVLIAYLVRDWRRLELVVSGIPVGFLLYFWWDEKPCIVQNQDS